MSITKDFEKMAWGSHGDECSYDTDLVNELLAHTRALEAMLKKHQYADKAPDNDPLCPECGALEPIGSFHGHRPNCQLGKLLDGVE